MATAADLIAALSYGQRETDELEQLLYDVKLATYKTTLRELLDEFDADAEVNISAGVDAKLRADAGRSARSQIRTRNRAMADFVRKYHDQSGFMARFEEWELQRTENRRTLVAVTDVYTAHVDATLGFFIENGLADRVAFDFGGHGDAAPACSICQALKAGSPWPLYFVQQLGVPHPNCRQNWHARLAGKPPLIWTAGFQPGGMLARETLIQRAGGQDQATELVERLAT